MRNSASADDSNPVQPLADALSASDDIQPTADAIRNLPDALAPMIAQQRWLIWRWETTPTGKPTKVPYQAISPKRKASSTNPSTWSDYATAVAAAEHADGIGFCLFDSEWAAFDVDDCRDPATGVIEPWATSLVERAGSYAEITVSGTGIRIIGTATGEKVHRKLRVANGMTVEPYRRAERYIVMTGDQLPGSKSILANIDEVMDEVVAELDGTGVDRSRGAQTLDAFEIIAPDDPRLAGLDPRWVALGHDGAGIAEEYGGDRSRAVFAFTCECIRAGIPDDVIASCLTHWRIGEHIRDQANAERALNRVMSRARQAVEDSKLFAMNERHCVLPIGGKTRVATWGADLDFPGRHTIVRFSSFADFKALHDKYRHTYKNSSGEAVSVKLGSWWVGNPNRRQYDGGMRFMPNRDEDVVGDTLNLWQGFAVAARKPEGKSGAAGCNLFLDHGLKIICSGNEAHFDYLMKREAFIAQRRTRSEIAVGYRSDEEGTGKGFWCRGFNRLYGRHAMEVQNPDHVIGKHNPHLENLLKLTADEALFALDPRHRNALYNLITEPHITIEPKFVDAYAANNYVNVDVISNARHFVPGSQRRLFVLSVSPARANDHDHFRAIDAQLRDGGYEALLYHLLYEIDIRDFNVRDVPKTAELAEQAAYSRKGVDLLVEIACNEGRVPCPNRDHPHISVITGRDSQFPGFDYFIERHPDRELARMGPLMVKRRLGKDWGCITGKAARKQEGGEQVGGIIWPSLADLRSRFEAKYGPQEWQHPEEKVWAMEFM